MGMREAKLRSAQATISIRGVKGLRDEYRVALRLFHRVHVLSLMRAQ